MINIIEYMGYVKVVYNAGDVKEINLDTDKFDEALVRKLLTTDFNLKTSHYTLYFKGEKNKAVFTAIVRDGEITYVGVVPLT